MSLTMICPNGPWGFSPLKPKSFHRGVAVNPDYIAADSGSDSDIFGAQQYAPLLDIEVLVQRAVVLAELEEATELRRSLTLLKK
tara:strand:- start:4495 stop:4746 length:252 start_codon:yes stop_codon:yes gene_type:complete